MSAWITQVESQVGPDKQPNVAKIFSYFQICVCVCVGRGVEEGEAFVQTRDSAWYFAVLALKAGEYSISHT